MRKNVLLCPWVRGIVPEMHNIKIIPFGNNRHQLAGVGGNCQKPHEALGFHTLIMR